MKKFSPALLAFLLAFTLALPAREIGKTVYVDPATVDFKALLGNPPAKGSPENQQDIAAVAKKTQERTPEDLARIKSEAHYSVFIFADTLGPWFDKKNLPVTTEFLKNVLENAEEVIHTAKQDWDRPRPPQQDAAIKPPIDVPTNASYPSGHAAMGLLDALVLAQLAPDLKDQLLARGRLVGSDRVLAGVHFPTDVAAGQKLAQILFDRIAANPRFQADLATAKAEFDSVRPKH